MATSEHGSSTGGPHDPLFELGQQRPRDQITRLDFEDVAAVGDDLAAFLDDSESEGDR